jgi:probable rRNA maturation factor
MSFTLTNTTANRSPVPFLKIKEAILGKEYQLSLALVGEKRAREVNRRSRHKDYAPNVLSFPLGRQAGEIYLAPSVARKEAPSFGHSFKRHLTFLYIHGLLHLKGYDHGRSMEKLEEKYLAKYG